MENIKNMTELRNDLCSLYTQLRKGEVEEKHAAAVSNVAGKIIKSAVAQLEHKKMVKDRSALPFME